MSAVPRRLDPAPGRAFRVGIVGAGRVGAVLGAALSRAGHQVRRVSGRSPASTGRIAALLPQARLVAPAEVPRGSDLVLLCVPDDSLSSVAHLLSTSVRPGQIVAHTCGAHGLSVLAPLAAAGARPLALHPAMTFTGTADDLSRLPGTSYGVTAPVELRALATRLVADLGGSVEWIAEQDRSLYHAALAHGANHLVTLVNEAMDRLRDAGVHHPQQVLGPLLRASLENTLARADAALTGPIARGDCGTVARHLAALQAAAPDSVAVYRALARRTADRAIASGRLAPTEAEDLLTVLAEPGLVPAGQADHKGNR